MEVDSNWISLTKKSRRTMLNWPVLEKGLTWQRHDRYRMLIVHVYHVNVYTGACGALVSQSQGWAGSTSPSSGQRVVPLSKPLYFTLPVPGCKWDTSLCWEVKRTRCAWGMANPPQQHCKIDESGPTPRKKRWVLRDCAQLAYPVPLFSFKK